VNFAKLPDLPRVTLALGPCARSLCAPSGHCVGAAVPHDCRADFTEGAQKTGLYYPNRLKPQPDTVGAFLLRGEYFQAAGLVGIHNDAMSLRTLVVG